MGAGLEEAIIRPGPLNWVISQPEAEMLQTVDSVVLFVPDLDEAVAWYRIVLGTEPAITADRFAAFTAGSSHDLVLVCGDGELLPDSAVLVCQDLEAALSGWRDWAGVVETECLGPGWPARLVTLRDPGGNCLVALEPASPRARVGTTSTA